MNEPTIFVAISIATVEVPPSPSITQPGTHMVGVGLFIASRKRDGWRFRSEAVTICAGQREEELLAWLADRLPNAGTAIGWQIDRRVVPALLDAAANAQPAIAHRLTARLAQVLRATVVDLAIEHGGAAAPPLREIAQDLAIASPTLAPDEIFNAWAFCTLETIRSDLATEALVLWEVFLRGAGLSGMEAEAATIAWMSRRRVVRPVSGAGDEA
jgi:hypothetical protein